MVRYRTYVAAISVAIHGFIHFLGIGGYFELIEMADLPYKTTLLGGTVDVGDAVIRVFTMLTAVAGVGFVASAIALVTGWRYW